jgi:hypothetical protein
MLGFRGHFSTKSRGYSTTLSALRADRTQHQRDNSATASLWPVPDSETTLVVAHWQFAGQGPPPALLSAAAIRLTGPSSSSPPKEASHAPASADCP